MSVEALPSDVEMFVYVIGDDDGPQKVGFSNNPTTRCRSLGGGVLKVHYAAAVSEADVRSVERYAHCLLYEFHQRGEWFDVTPQVAQAAVDDAVAAIERGDTPPFYPMLVSPRPMTKPRVLSVRMSEAMHAKFVKMAAKDRRPISQFIELALEDFLREKGEWDDDQTTD